MKFINRISEMKVLERFYNEPGFRFLPIYGKRRIGKTQLVKQFISDKNHLYFLSDRVAEGEQLKRISELLGEKFKDRIFKENGAKNWYQIFDFLKTRADGKKLVLIIDEFPYLATANHAISSIYQKGIDEYLKGTDIFLILLGSSIGMMEKEVLFYKAPLYGRRSGQLFMEPMDFDEVVEFLPIKSFEEQFHFYSILGGIPAYWLQMKSNLSLWENIKEKILPRESFLYNEVEFLLREELKEPRNYFVILKAIAQGKAKQGEIVNDVGMDKNSVGKYLSVLQELRIVRKEIPITEKNAAKSKRGLYFLDDPFCRFWFHFIFPKKSYLEEMGETPFLEKHIKPSWEYFVSPCYENLCRVFLRKEMARKGMQYERMGRWWDNQNEIDIVAIGEGDILFGEAKWSTKKIGTDGYEDLKKKMKEVPFSNKLKPHFAFFSKSGFTDAMLKIAKEEGLLLFEGNKLRTL